MSPEDEQALLELARGTMVGSFEDRPPPACSVRIGEVPRCGGLFVSLHRGRVLRGCIGTFSPRENLEDTVRAMSVSVLQDPRFVSNPVSLDELTSLEIEISILSIPVPTDDPMSLETGDVWEYGSGCAAAPAACMVLALCVVLPLFVPAIGSRVDGRF